MYSVPSTVAITLPSKTKIISQNRCMWAWNCSPTTSSFFTYPTPILSFNWKNSLSSLLLLFIIPPLSLLLYHIFLSICALILYFFCPFLYLSHFSWLIKCFFSMQGPACLIEATQSMDKHVIPRKTPPPLRAGERLPMKGEANSKEFPPRQGGTGRAAIRIRSIVDRCQEASWDSIRSATVA